MIFSDKSASQLTRGHTTQYTRACQYNQAYFPHTTPGRNSAPLPTMSSFQLRKKQIRVARVHYLYNKELDHIITLLHQYCCWYGGPHVRSVPFEFSTSWLPLLPAGFLLLSGAASNPAREAVRFRSSSEFLWASCDVGFLKLRMSSCLAQHDRKTGRPHHGRTRHNRINSLRSAYHAGT